MVQSLSGECPKTFEVAQQTERDARLQHANARLKKLMGELTLELKKSTRRCGPDQASHGGRRARNESFVPQIQA